MRKGDRGFQRDVRVFFAQPENGFTEIQVTAVGHSADKLPYTGVVYGFHSIEYGFLQPETAGVAFLKTPGEFRGPVSCEGTGSGEPLHADLHTFTAIVQAVYDFTGIRRESQKK